MHDDMPYDPIQGQGQRHECLKASQKESTVSPAWDYTMCLKKEYHPTTNDNFKNSCRIRVTVGTNST